jgi:hypothetical protein
MLSSAPRQLWKIGLSAWSGHVNVVAGQPAVVSGLELKAMDGDPYLRPAERRLDVAGDGNKVLVRQGYWGKLVPTVPGVQRVAWTSTWGTAPASLQCFSYGHLYFRTDSG